MKHSRVMIPADSANAFCSIRGCVLEPCEVSESSSTTSLEPVASLWISVLRSLGELFQSNRFLL